MDSLLPVILVIQNAFIWTKYVINVDIQFSVWRVYGITFVKYVKSMQNIMTWLQQLPVAQGQQNENKQNHQFV